MPAPLSTLAQLTPLPSDRGRPIEIGSSRMPQVPSSASSDTTDSVGAPSSATSAHLSAPPSPSGSCRGLEKKIPGLRLEYSDTWSDNESTNGDGDETAEETPGNTIIDHSVLDSTQPLKNRRASTTLLLSQDEGAIRRILADKDAGAAFVKKCCGGGCVRLGPRTTAPLETTGEFIPLKIPNNKAFASLNIARHLEDVALNAKLNGVLSLPEPIMTFEAVSPAKVGSPSVASTVDVHPPTFVQPHPPYNVFSAPVYHARELTKPGAHKKTIHMDIDVTDYPEEMAGVDFKVGGAIGVCPRNSDEVVNDIFACLGVPKFLRNKPMLLKTGPVRWPTIWGEEQARELVTTRRELLTWCVDVQSTAPTKLLFRVLAEHASDEHERQILMYLSSETGQPTFCSLRDSHITLPQLLHAFPSTSPPLAHLMSVLSQLQPRFYSLSNDPEVSSARAGVEGTRKLIEIAVTIHEDEDWTGDIRTGVGSGFMYRLAKKIIDAQDQGLPVPQVRLPMFRGLMANPLSREGAAEGPMMLVGAGVGIAPFRGFILNRLRYANCANKVWLIQGIRDASLDELYAGEMGPEEAEKSIKHVVQSRKKNRTENEARYVQDELRAQADTVWDVINAPDGRICVCGSSKGMGQGVEEALVEIARLKGRLNQDEAADFWRNKKESGQYITETW